MKNSPDNFYQEGFIIKIPKKWTSFLSKRKIRTFRFKQPEFSTWSKIAETAEAAGFTDFTIKDFERLSKKGLREAAYIIGLSSSPFSLFPKVYGYYFHSHLDPKKLGQLAYMVILLNRTKYVSSTLFNADDITLESLLRQTSETKLRIAGQRGY